MGCCSSDPDKSRDKSKNKRKQYSENVHPNKNEQVVPVQPNKKNKATKQDEKLLNLYNIICQNNNFTLLLDQQVFIQLFHQIRGTQLPKLSANALISLLQNYIRYSIKLITFNSLKVQVPFTYNLSDYGHIFGRQIREIRDNINTQNNCQVRTLRYFDQFKKYKFGLGEQNKGEIDKLQNKVKELSQHDPLAVFYMVSYIKIACKQMEENGQSMQSINKNLKKKVDEINQSFSPNADFKQDLLYIEALQKKELDRLKNEEHDYKKITFNLLERDKKKEINKRIVQIADKSKTQQRSLHGLTYGCCMENEGFGYSLGSKIRDIEDENAIKRVKQKLFKDEIEKQYKNKSFKSKSIKDLRKEQFKFKKNVMKDIYENLGKVQFNVTDLLRGRCFFKKFSQINNSALAIIQKIKEAKRMGHKMQLIQVDNRLKDATKDLVLKIKINQTVTQFQFGLRFRQTQSEIYHKMYEISRSEMLSPLVYLYEVERHLTNQYFSLLDEVVKEINQPREVKSDIKKKAEELKKFIKFKEDHQDDSSQDEAGQSPHYPYEGLYKQQNLIPQRIEELKKQGSMRTGDYALELGTYQEACRLYRNQIEEVAPLERLTKQKAIKKISEMLALNRIKHSKSLEQINLKLQ